MFLEVSHNYILYSNFFIFPQTYDFKTYVPLGYVEDMTIKYNYQYMVHSPSL